MSGTIDVLHPDKPKRVVIIASNPAVSKQTGWPIGFWWAELAHPYWEFSERGYTVDIASPDGGKLEGDSWSDPRDASKRLWKAGIVRENYARADELGVVIVFEVDSVETARRYTDDFPLTKGGFIEWFFIPVQVPLPLEVLFDPKVDVNEPYDRTTTTTGATR